MLCVVIKGPSYDEVRRQITQAIPYADMIELRIESFSSLDLEELKKIRAEFSIPMIFTLRSSSQGGSYKGAEPERLQDLRRLASLKPEYLDVEFHVPVETTANIAHENPEIKLIISHHDFDETPSDLDALYTAMQKIPAWGYKIAVAANSALDAMRLMCWAKNIQGNKIILAMGEQGQITRILSPLLQCAITYASIDEGSLSAPGQVPAKLLLERFRFRKLGAQTAIYGLIGDPVEQSIGDLVHNRFFEEQGLDAVYVKIQLKAEELETFLALAAQLPFKGLSVTQPLKEQIVAYVNVLSEESKAIGAVNTLCRRDNKWEGCNTDGKGALNAIEEQFSVEGGHVVIIGAGGAAKAIAFEAKQRGAFVTVVNRHVKRAEEVANRLHVKAAGLEEMQAIADRGYDVLINSTSDEMPIDAEAILPGSIVMDVKTKAKDTAFFQVAEKKGGHLIYGYQMYLEQAIGQYLFWFPGNFSEQQCRSFLNSHEWIE